MLSDVQFFWRPDRSQDFFLAFGSKVCTIWQNHSPVTQPEEKLASWLPAPPHGHARCHTLKGDEDRVKKISQLLSDKVNEATSCVEATAAQVPDMGELKSAIEQRKARQLKRLGENLRDWADTVREQIEEVLQLGEEVLLLAEDFEHAEQAEAAEMNEDS